MTLSWAYRKSVISVPLVSLTVLGSEHTPDWLVASPYHANDADYGLRGGHLHK